MRSKIRTKLPLLMGYTVLSACFCGGLTKGSTLTDEPQVTNAKLETQSVAESLSGIVQRLAGEREKPLWIGYSVEEVAGERSICCGNNRDDNDFRCGTCDLENEHNNWSGSRGKKETVNLESHGKLVVLLRADKKQVMRIRMGSTDCTLDAGGLRFVWLTGVKSEQSVALLTKYVNAEDFRSSGDQGLSGQALAAIAMHGDASADRAFASFIAAEQPVGLREKAAFWLGAARGKSGLALLQKMAKNDPSADVRAQVAFALYVSPEPKAVDEIILMAKDDRDAHVRGQALFWLAQKAGTKASSAITGAIENDPDTEVKKKAVFALSQMPKDEGVPKLIEVAQTNRNPEVRKQAMFWLGQSNDPRALQFFEKVLTQ
jgi:HEAT repeat protein